MKILVALAMMVTAVTAQGSETFDPNVPPALKSQMFADMTFLRTLQAPTASPLHQKIFGPVNGVNYLKFFENHIQSIGFNSCGSSTAVACVIPFMDPTKMWITPNYVRFSHPQIARIMIVFHEARHTETANNNWPHANCPLNFNDYQGQPIKSIWNGAPLAGSPSCDTNPYGSFGSSLVMMKNISKYCANCSEKVKMDAGIYADDQLRRIVDPRAVAFIKQDLYHR